MNNITKAVKIYGGQTKLGNALGVKQASVWDWMNKYGQAPAKYIPRISELTNGEVSVNDLLADHQKSNKESAA
ncbi:MAG: helix-turn-helix domain-containing protein [Pseudoalteromonas sp.]|uniref:YdaS family helix-turn-helix protein n=1 Tax=Pseudoalteromonas sp. TaxID=53249 RepID=UPI0025E9A7D7|nr:YdaS family helix-turn-helix protein [Pseudoalteromonas sp.]MCH2089759.1 helix-turn-helix domain-containing protein [Pseudoalteromonas sp.]